VGCVALQYHSTRRCSLRPRLSKVCWDGDDYNVDDGIMGKMSGRREKGVRRDKGMGRGRVSQRRVDRGLVDALAGSINRADAAAGERVLFRRRTRDISTPSCSMEYPDAGTGADAFPIRHPQAIKQREKGRVDFVFSRAFCSASCPCLCLTAGGQGSSSLGP